ncbi:Gfo/Idh/MocA family protein [Schaalia canis]|uniref:Gfo/Idh/MocA family oxidoreductase n=1 Tax=Schaalia canis TaxID=100469 RepID=A0A3P1SG25_9ACTO|nr:Gfo/Idh/MocA family oxidoreductase [Schaalia canis]RRC96243.1 gfo/Idh/MocA family oxidoreductase [Schaalia canis]
MVTFNPHAALAPLPEPIAHLARGVELPDPMDAPPLRWGILGAGGIAGTFARDVPAYSSGRIVAVASRDHERAQSFAHAHGIGRVHDSYEQLVADPQVDAIYVATIHPMHAEHALLAIEAGKPVLVEKAFTMTAAQARRVFDAARERGVFVMEAMWTRHLPHQRVLRQILANGALGRIVSAQADHGQSLWHVPRLTDPALGGGALLDLGVYSLSFIQSIARDARLVSADGVLTDSGVDVANVAVLRVGEALAVARSNFSGRSATAAEVVCEHGALELPLQFYRPGALQLRTFGGEDPDGDTVTWDATMPGGFQYEAAEAARCVATGVTESCVMPWSDTLAVMELMDEVRSRVGVRYPCE